MKVEDLEMNSLKCRHAGASLVTTLYNKSPDFNLPCISWERSTLGCRLNQILLYDMMDRSWLNSLMHLWGRGWTELTQARLGWGSLLHTASLQVWISTAVSPLP